ncbi:glycosyltransferase family 4 protein [Brevundimonas sp.]|uniref:glycosyltransferase family 4 protein n=1 Tax=Brevundimonas sp. TaxID=1871086 RepID=UPI002D337261|nr:glycosyltransferase family 4 protein [Brevundimonas sp.]HYC69246.1 glycosyltransferase family 4 protein [Brevundimonas sp.]
MTGRPASILYLTQTFPPEPGATKRPFKQAQALQALGHQITVITALPHYPNGRFEGRDRFRLWRRSRMDDVDVLRLWCIPAPNSGTLRRLLGFASLALSVIIAGLILRRRDVVMGSVTTPGMEVAALVIAKAKRSRVVLEARDLVPDSWITVGLLRSKWLQRRVSAFYRRIWAQAWIVAATDTAMVRRLIERGARHVIHLPHAADFDEIDCWDRAASRAELGVEGRFVVVYAGSLNSHYHTPTIAEAGARAAASVPGIVTIILGAGADAVAIRAVEQRAPAGSVRLMPAVAPAEAGRILVAADLFVHPLWFVGADALSGTKIVEYLAAGRPTVFCVPPSQVKSLDTHGAGICVPLQDAAALASAIEAYFRDPEAARQSGAAARALAESGFDRRSVVAAFSRALKSALST